MPIDASIPLQVQPLKVEDPMNMMAKAYAIQNARQTGQLNALNLRQAQSNIANQEGLSNYMATADLSNPAAAQEMLKYGAPGATASASLLASRKGRLDAAKTQQDLYRVTANMVFNDPSHAKQYVAQFGQQTGVDVAPYLQQLDMIGENPDLVRQWASAHMENAAGQIQLQTQNLGDRTRILRVNKMTGRAEVVPGSEAAMGISPDKQFQGATDAAGWTPQAIDIAAQTYLQTGQVPPTGYGKSGSALRGQILQRAYEISNPSPTARPVDTGAAATASTARQAKMDTATATKAEKDFSTGVQGQMVTSFSTAIEHLNTMEGMVDALANGNIQLFNKIGNTVAKQIGRSAPTSFDGVKQVIGAEIQKAIVRAGGTGAEREEAANAFSTASSPAQLRDLIQKYRELMGGQLVSLANQYEQGTGKKDFRKKLLPQAQVYYDKVSQSTAEAAPSGAPKVGTVDNGYRFKGGDPADSANWEKQ